MFGALRLNCSSNWKEAFRIRLSIVLYRVVIEVGAGKFCIFETK